MWARLVKYGLIGVINAAIDFCIYWAFIHIGGLEPLFSHILAWLFAVQFSYVMNGLVTFRQKFNQLISLKKWALFVLSGWAALVASTVTLYIFLPHLGAYQAKIVATLASFLVGFIFNQYIVFKERLSL